MSKENKKSTKFQQHTNNRKGTGQSLVICKKHMREKTIQTCQSKATEAEMLLNSKGYHTHATPFFFFFFRLKYQMQSNSE